MRQRFCKVCRGWHDLDEPWPHNCRPEPNYSRSDLPLPQVARTSLDDLWNPVDGQKYSCSRNFEKAVKAKGCEIIGNDSSLRNARPKPIESPKGVGEDLKRAWDQLSS